MIATLEWCLAQVWRLSWQASALIVLVLLVQWLAGQRLSARWRYDLWLLVVARLVIPFLWQSPWSVYNAVNWGTDRATAVILPVVEPKATRVVISDAPPTAERSKIEEPPPPEITRPPVAETPVVGPVIHPLKAIVTRTPHNPFPWKSALALGWTGGVLFLSIYVIVSSWRMNRRIRGATPITDPEILSLLDECRERMGLRRSVPALETAPVQSPAVIGFWRPQLLLPTGLAQSFVPAELRHVFLHELAHIRRLDLPMNWLLTLLQVLHWFNPVVGYGLRRMRADRESACDALAIERNGGTQPGEYGRTIIKLLENAARPIHTPGVMGILESKSQMIRRVRMIAHFRQNPRWSWLAVGLTMALAVVGLTEAGHRVRAEADKAADSQKTMKITVLDAATGQPIPGVILSSGAEGDAAQPLRTVRTDASGVAQAPIAFQQGFTAVHADYAPISWERNPYKQNAKPSEECTIKLEHGETIGGVVREEAGHPLAGIAVEVRGMEENTNAPQSPDFAQHLMIGGPTYHDAVTDAQGRWSYERFPQSADDLVLIFKRSDGGRYAIHAPPKQPYFQLNGVSTPNARQDAEGQKLLTTLPEGIEVRGVVHNAAGHPLAGITVTERDNRNRAAPISVSKTDAQGRFSLSHRDPHQILLVLSGDGLATALRVVNVEPGLAEQDFALQSAQPLRVRVVDEAGAPVERATLTMAELETGWTAQTDAQGRAIWPAAPVEAYPYTLAPEKHRTRILSLTPGKDEILITVHSSGVEGTEVTVKPVDENGKPLAAFTISAAYRNQPMTFEPLGEGRDGVCVAIVPADKIQSSSFRIKVEAPGLVPYFSEPLDPLAGEPNLAPKLSTAHSEPVRGKVLQPDGLPASNASAILVDTGVNRSSVNIMAYTGNFRVETRDAKAVRADTDGAFSLPMAPALTMVLLIHEQGFLATTIRELQTKPEMRLAPWGAIEGRLTVNGQARAGQRMTFQSLNQLLPYYLSVSVSSKSDRDGHFRLAPAPPGVCLVYATQPSDGEWPQGYQTRVEVKSGEATHVDIAARGGTVTGRIQLDPPDADLDWQKQIATALLRERMSETVAMPNFEDFIYQRDYLEATARPLEIKLRSTYPLTIEPDGSFRSEGIPAGAYTVEVTAQKADPANRNWTLKIGTLDQPVVIPPVEGNNAVALGNFKLVLEKDAVAKQPAVQFTAETMKGQPLSVADYAGKQVLLLFWATWAPPSAEKLAEWKRLYEAHGADPRFVMLGISLDDDAAAAQRFADEHGWAWPQARIVGPQKSETTERLEVDTLPSALLLGSDGRLLARNPVETRLRAVVDAFLAPQR